MASERDLELLDDYIANRLPANERVAFEERLTHDPALKAEYSFQLGVANSIRTARSMQLKAMLNAVPVPPVHGGGSAVAAKILGTVALAGAVMTGVYYFTQKDKDEPQTTETQSVVTTQPEAPQQEPTSEPLPDATPQAQNQQQPASSGNNKSPKSEETSPSEKTKEPVLDVFDPSDENTSVSHAAETTESKANVASKTTVVVETDSNNTKYTFHYQFKEGKLMLYGAFEKNLYEILEFFADNKRTVFLYYKDKYYLLNEADDKIHPLNPITDPELLKKLKEYRGN
jgi:hypothetical protein